MRSLLCPGLAFLVDTVLPSVCGLHFLIVFKFFASVDLYREAVASTRLWNWQSSRIGSVRQCLLGAREGNQVHRRAQGKICVEIKIFGHKTQTAIVDDFQSALWMLRESCIHWSALIRLLIWVFFYNVIFVFGGIFDDKTWAKCILLLVGGCCLAWGTTSQ